MSDIFSNEQAVIVKAEHLIGSNFFSSEKEMIEYSTLMEEYKKLLRQMTRMVKMSDIMSAELKSLTNKLEVACNTDVLTDLYNRRFFNEIYSKEWKSALKNKSQLSIIMADVDHFKRYNDTYGHIAGDECLLKVAEVIKNAITRPRDIVVRYGGEEFVILLPDCDINGAKFIAEIIMEDLHECCIVHETSPVKPYVTMSCGVASVQPREDLSTDLLLIKMDEALYSAKSSGRNCIKTIEL
jgi:diguanylate cyclase (GGDEF)-like protein